MKKIMIIALIALVMMGCSNSSKNALTLEEAQEIALKEVSGKVIKAHEDSDDGVNYYDFTIVTDSEKYEVEVDANSGKIMKMEKDDDYVGTNTNPSNETDHHTTGTTNNNNTSNNEATITAEEAQQKAMDRVGGGYLVKCELDYENGTLQYEIEIKNGNKEYDVDIDANTGEIIKFKEEYDD